MKRLSFTPGKPDPAIAGTYGRLCLQKRAADWQRPRTNIPA